LEQEYRQCFYKHQQYLEQYGIPSIAEITTQIAKREKRFSEEFERRTQGVDPKDHETIFWELGGAPRSGEPDERQFSLLIQKLGDIPKELIRYYLKHILPENRVAPYYIVEEFVRHQDLVNEEDLLAKAIAGHELDFIEIIPEGSPLVKTLVDNRDATTQEDEIAIFSKINSQNANLFDIPGIIEWLQSNIFDADNKEVQALINKLSKYTSGPPMEGEWGTAVRKEDQPQPDIEYQQIESNMNTDTLLKLAEQYENVSKLTPVSDSLIDRFQKATAAIEKELGKKDK